MRLETFLRTLGDMMARTMRREGVGDLRCDMWSQIWALTVADCDVERDQPGAFVADVLGDLALARELMRIYGRD